ncbi:hypothetical protein [Helicobacter cetorum]|uniref:Uncharacterized protein n=1 Tax=Helicobacter cetorum (strain ATCC BAA-429 / MIT 00-7128) TaxID=182217 RepID=I0EMJ5_HELC0|nr:hypothetical protein [Helicobacter cetorum]AFI04164.1 hypothetical protein HCW_04485 [Helicobacter cetorum MIT 00-7128]
MTKKFMRWILIIGALVCVLLGGFIVFTSISVKKFLNTHINNALENQASVRFTPFACQGLFKISCTSKDLSLLDSKSLELLNFKNLVLGLESMDKSTLTLSIKSQAKSPILERLIAQDLAHIPLKNLNTLLGQIKPEFLNCSLQFSALDAKTLDSHLKCHLTNKEKVLAYSFSQDTKVTTQNDLSLRNVLETLSSKDSEALGNLEENLRFSLYHLGLSLESKHLKSILEPFYNQNKESLSSFSPYFSLRPIQTPNIPYDSALLFLEKHFITLFNAKDNVFYQDFLKALVSMAKNERSEIILDAQVKDTTKLSFNAMLESLSQNLFKSYQFSVK